MKLTESNSVNLGKPLAESAVAPGECGSVPDERAAFEHAFKYFVLKRRLGDYVHSHVMSLWEGWQARAELDMQHNQPNSDHVAVIGAEPETSIKERLRNFPLFFLNGSRWMQSTQKEPICIEAADYIAKLEAKAELFKNWNTCPGCKAKWKELPENSPLMKAHREFMAKEEKALQSGIGLLDGRPHEQNAVQTEQLSLSDARDERKSFEWWAINNQPWLLERSTDDAQKLLILTAWEAWQAAISAQRQDSDKDAGIVEAIKKYGRTCAQLSAWNAAGVVRDTSNYNSEAELQRICTVLSQRHGVQPVAPSDKNAERLAWIIPKISGKEYRRIGIEYGNLEEVIPAIDTAIANGAPK